MTRKTKLAAAIAIVAFGAWFYFLPYIAFSGMKSAIDARDASRLAGYVNFPALKDGIKAGLSARIAARVSDTREKSLFGALGAALAGVFVDPLVDAFVTPESLAMILKAEMPKPAPPPARQPPPSAPAPPASPPSAPASPASPPSAPAPPASPPPPESATPTESKREQSMSYESFDRFVVSVKKKGSTDQPFSLVFTREDWFSWKLSALRMPQ